MKILITGCLGKVARFGVIQVLEKEFDIRLTDYKEPEKKLKHEFIKADIRDYEDAKKIVRGVDAIVHLGAIANPNEDPILIYSTNLMATANLLEASNENEIIKFIFASSEHVYGIPYCPEYLPIDEAHPIKPNNKYIAYKFSKLLSEKLGKGYTIRSDFSFISLRIGLVCCKVSPYRNIKKENIKDYKRNLWAHVDPRDIGQAVMLSLLKDIKGFEVFNVIAEDHVFPEIPSLELIKKFFPNIKKINNTDKFISKGDGSFISIYKAKKILGYKPEYNFRNYQKWLKEGNREEDYYETESI